MRKKNHWMSCQRKMTTTLKKKRRHSTCAKGQQAWLNSLRREVEKAVTHFKCRMICESLRFWVGKSF